MAAPSFFENPTVQEQMATAVAVKAYSAAYGAVMDWFRANAGTADQMALCAGAGCAGVGKGVINMNSDHDEIRDVLAKQFAAEILWNPKDHSKLPGKKVSPAPPDDLQSNKCKPLERLGFEIKRSDG